MRPARTAPALLTVQQTAERLGISVGHTRRMIASGDLRATRVGGRAVRVAEDDLSAFIDSKRSAQ